MTEPIIRAASPGDLPAITAIYADAVLNGTATFELEPPGETEMGRRMTALVEAGYPYFVAEVDGGVLGYGYAGPYRPRPGYRHTVEDSVYIARSGWRQGIGRSLLRRLIEECETLDFRQMIAVIGDSSHTASIGLHQAEGFVIVARLPTVGHKFGRWLDSMLMQRALGTGAGGPPTR
jgi:L-amino acid N-acyltransferase YncA